jgi:3-phosphoshikimate 1-carboxyvinyltransferase
MQYILKAPDAINTTIKLPASKSISNRSLIIHALAGGKLKPENISDCDDTEVILRAMKDMPEVIDIKAAGTAMRFMSAYLSVTPGTHVLTGTARMKQRPIRILVDALRQLGAQISYEGEEGYPPLRITGSTLQGGALEIAGNVSSQYISALLMIGPVLKEGLTLRLTGKIISRPYIDMTLFAMQCYGAEVEWTDIDTIQVSNKPYTEVPFTIENDWSAASYWYETLLLNDNPDSEIKMTGLMDGSRQGDSSVRYIFSLLGIKTTFKKTNDNTPTTVTIKRDRRPLPKLEYDFVNSPDLAQTFVVACALMNIPFRFTGLATLKIKETDRIEALKKEMRKLGYVIKSVDDCELNWDGERCQPDEQPEIDTYNDHRMAMAFAPAAQKIKNLRINNPEVVSKSYPQFWSDMQQAGFEIIDN